MTDVSTDRAARFEPRLKARLAELEARLRGIESDLERPGDPDDEERAIEREGHEVQEDLGRAGLDEIRMIRAALDRISKGEYGYCVNCGEEIAEARLEVVPHAARCRVCA
jgi:RNA polymerase-binding transcription factor DksA